MRIVVNGQNVEIEPAEAISYERILELAATGGDAPLAVFFTLGAPPETSGEMAPGEAVPVYEGMIFTLRAPRRS
jgi:hypothetical protein